MPHQRADFLGAWRLEQWRIEYDTGRRTYPFGDDAAGLLLYAPEMMTASVFSADRAPLPFANPRRASAADRAHLFDSAFYYAGSWHLDGDCVVHEVTLALNPELVGTRQRRVAVFSSPQQLELSAEEPAKDGAARRHVLSWRR